MPRMLPKVTIMIPTYGQAGYIGQAVESALMQDYENLEVVVSDDCSPDHTQQVLEKYREEPRFTYSRNRTNLGRVANYHHTLYHLAGGDWVINLDGDDYYTDPHFVSKALSEIARAEGQGFNVAAYFYAHDTGRLAPYAKAGASADSLILAGRDYFIRYAEVGSFSHMGSLYRKSLAVQLGDLYTKPYQASDFHSIVRLALLGDIIVSSQRIGHWRVHGANTTLQQVGRKQVEAMQCFDDIESFARPFYDAASLAEWRRAMDKRAFYDYVSTYVYSRKCWESFCLLVRSFRFKYSYFRLWFYFIFNR